MAIVRTDDKHYKAIADVIRNQPGYTDNYTPEQMPLIITSAMVDANAAGMIAGYDDGYVLGKRAQYDEFWDAFQQNGERTAYNSAFGGQWTPEIWKPKYPIRPTNIYMMFFSNTGERLVIPDFVQFCKENNIIFDLSNAKGTAIYALAGLHTNHHGVLDFSCSDTSATLSIPSLFYSHNNVNGIKIIDEFISSERTIFTKDTFQFATNLEEVNFSGVITSDNFNVSYCTKLTHDSLMSIINTLYDYSGTATTKTITLGAENLAKLTDAEKKTATDKGWSLV